MATKKNEGVEKPTQATNEGQTRGIICYKSTLLNQYFDDYESLVKAEEEYKLHQAEQALEKQRRDGIRDAVYEAWERLKKVRDESYAKLAKVTDEVNEDISHALEEYDACAKAFRDEFGYDLLADEEEEPILVEKPTPKKRYCFGEIGDGSIESLVRAIFKNL